ncbi:hypothetical protein [Streptomyces sp. LaPpAH-108]|uniref:hypothetical protein n=1 Tax=Streptomyces sp. LaPpAH-108 TaxID=1155714 RepID=UPI001319C51A|nr:hypothetical protein [Streptomyces sp. LaPpAH-108]
MSDRMEGPNAPKELYRALGSEVNPDRPILTGDVFENVDVLDTDGSTTKRTVMILDHPCSLRKGTKLVPRLLTAEVRRSQQGPWDEGFLNRMFLPAPFPGADGEKKPCAAFFDSCYHVSPEQLEAATRIACLTTRGINLMLQRRVKHFSRVTVATHKFNEANAGVFEEADMLEDWCFEREIEGVKLSDAIEEFNTWIREDNGSGMRQDLLKDDQYRSSVRQEMNARIKELRLQGRA